MLLTLLQNLPPPTGAGAILETQDQIAAAGAPSVSGYARVNESTDVASTLARISSTATASIRESHELIASASSVRATGAIGARETIDRPYGLANVISYGQASIVEPHLDIVVAVDIVSTTGTAAIREPGDAVSATHPPTAVGTVSSTCVVSRIEQSDRVSITAILPVFGSAEILEGSEASSAISLTPTVITGHAAINETAVIPGHAWVGPIAVVVSAEGPVLTNALTIPVDITNGGAITSAVFMFAPGVTDKSAAIAALLGGELDRAVNLSTLANSTFS